MLEFSSVPQNLLIKLAKPKPTVTYKNCSCAHMCVMCTTVVHNRTIVETIFTRIQSSLLRCRLQERRGRDRSVEYTWSDKELCTSSHTVSLLTWHSQTFYKTFWQTFELTYLTSVMLAGAGGGQHKRPQPDAVCSLFALFFCSLLLVLNSSMFMC